MFSSFWNASIPMLKRGGKLNMCGIIPYNIWCKYPGISCAPFQVSLCDIVAYWDSCVMLPQCLIFHCLSLLLGEPKTGKTSKRKSGQKRLNLQIYPSMLHENAPSIFDNPLNTLGQWYNNRILFVFLLLFCDIRLHKVANIHTGIIHNLGIWSCGFFLRGGAACQIVTANKSFGFLLPTFCTRLQLFWSEFLQCVGTSWFVTQVCSKLSPAKVQ